MPDAATNSGGASSTRRSEIKRLLEQSTAAISASTLAERLSVSRQVIVGDVAILRAGGAEILSTPKGYVAGSATADTGYVFKLACVHSNALLCQELYAIVDNGGRVIDVIVEHPVYGQIVGQLDICARCDADDFTARMQSNDAALLSGLTGGVHLHTVSCRDKRDAERIRKALGDLGVLYSDE